MKVTKRQLRSIILEAISEHDLDTQVPGLQGFPSNRVVVEWDLGDHDPLEGFEDLPQIVNLPSDILAQYESDLAQYGEMEAVGVIGEWLDDTFGWLSQWRFADQEIHEMVAHPRDDLSPDPNDDFPIVVGYQGRSEIAYDQQELDEILDDIGPRGIRYSLDSLAELEPRETPMGAGIENYIREGLHDEGLQEKAIAAAEHAVSVVGYPQGGMIENEIHNYLETEYGMDPMGDEIWSVADQALSVAGNLLGVGPDTL